MEPTEIQSSSRHEIHNDWDILSLRFQVEAAAYLQPVALLLVGWLVLKRSKAFIGVKFMDFKPTLNAAPPQTTSTKKDEENE
jgi:hypothetical protein